jgi:hypothetical protein
MLSAFQGRDIGFGRPLTPEELARVNAERAGKDYFSEEAAMALNKTKAKPPLTSTPFVRYIHVGVNNDGYWNSMHMALQLEDVVDCLKVLYPPESMTIASSLTTVLAMTRREKEPLMLVPWARTLEELSL